MMSTERDALEAAMTLVYRTWTEERPPLYSEAAAVIALIDAALKPPAPLETYLSRLRPEHHAAFTAHYYFHLTLDEAVDVLKNLEPPARC